MPRLHIYVSEKGGATVSKFGKTKDSDKIVFHNQHATDTLKVQILGDAVNSKALCQGTTAFPTFSVPPKGKEAFTICGGYQAQSFEYTAQIGNLVLEDPIIIIEKSGFYGGSVSLTTVILTAGAAAAAGIFLGFRLARSGSPRT